MSFIINPYSFGGVSYDADAQAFFTRVTSAGGTLSATEKLATNQLVLDMKTAGIWSSMKAIYPMVGASAAACAQNLKSSSFTGSFTSGWTFASTGVTGNGTSAYINTQCTPAQMAQDSCHLSIYNRTNSAGSFVDIGCTTGVHSGNNFQVSSRFSPNTNLSVINSLTAAGFTQNISSGLQLISRIAFTGFSFFNNITKTAVTNSSVPPNSVNIYIGARNINNSTIDFPTNRECAFASIGDGLTDTQASDFYTAVQTFNQTLSRQVGAQIVSDADAQAYIYRVYAAGGTLTNTEATAVNQLTIDMKASNVWTSMKAVYPMIGSSAAACAQNLKSASFTGTFSSGWTFASTGVTPNGTSAYMDTSLIPNTSLASNNFSCGYYSNLNIASTSSNTGEIGIFQSASQMLGVSLQRSLNGNNFLADGYGQNILISGNTNSDFFGIESRTSTTSLKLWKNNVLSGTNTSTDLGIRPTISITIGKMNGLTGFSNRRCAFAYVSDGLTDTQASDLYTNVQTFNTTLSRQV